MGTLERFRTISPYAMGAFAVVFVGFMIIQDAGLDLMNRGGVDRKTAVIAEVNGDEIKYYEFDDKVNQNSEQQRKQAEQQGQTDFDLDYSQVRTQVWQELIESALINQVAKQTGVVVTREVVADLLINTPPDFVKQWFTDSSGTFQRQAYLEMITSPEAYVNKSQADAEQKAKLLKDIREQLGQVADYMMKTETQSSVMQAINYAASVTSPAYAKQKFMDENVVSDVAYIAFDTRSENPDDYKVTDKEIEEYYNANKKYYKVKEQRKVKYLSLPIQPSAQDTLQSNKKLQKVITMFREATNKEDSAKVFDRYLAEYAGESKDYALINDIDMNKAPYLTDLPTGQIAGPLSLGDGAYFFRVDDRRDNPENLSVKASHILINFDQNKDSAKAVAEALLKKAKSGADFATLAQENSKDPGSGRQGGDLGYFGKGKMVKEFEDAAFAAGIGEIVGPIESQFGFHIIKVTDKKSAEIKYSEIKIAPKVTNSTRKSLMKEAFDIIEKVKQGNTLDTIAFQLNKRVNESGYIEKSKPILGNYYLTAQAFKNPKGTVLEPIELKNQGIVIVQVTEERKAGVVTLEEKKGDIEGILKNRKMLDALKAKAEAVYNKVKSVGDLAQAATVSPEFNVQFATAVKNNGAVPNSGGRDFGFTANTLTLPVNTINAPVRGEVGYYIIQITNRIEPNAEQIKKDLPEFTKSLYTNAKSNSYFNWFQQLKNDANIIDYRKTKDEY